MADPQKTFEYKPALGEDTMNWLRGFASTAGPQAIAQRRAAAAKATSAMQERTRLFLGAAAGTPGEMHKLVGEAGSRFASAIGLGPEETGVVSTPFVGDRALSGSSYGGPPSANPTSSGERAGQWGQRALDLINGKKQPDPNAWQKTVNYNGRMITPDQLKEKDASFYGADKVAGAERAAAWNSQTADEKQAAWRATLAPDQIARLEATGNPNAVNANAWAQLAKQVNKPDAYGPGSLNASREADMAAGVNQSATGDWRSFLTPTQVSQQMHVAPTSPAAWGG